MWWHGAGIPHGSVGVLHSFPPRNLQWCLLFVQRFIVSFFQTHFINIKFTNSISAINLTGLKPRRPPSHTVVKSKVRYISANFGNANAINGGLTGRQETERVTVGHGVYRAPSGPGGVGKSPVIEPVQSACAVKRARCAIKTRPGLCAVHLYHGFLPWPPRAA